jgi:hypothetical protein
MVRRIVFRGPKSAWSRLILAVTCLELAVPVGWSGTPPVYGTIYSLVNGMESSLVLLAFATVAWTMLRADEARTTRQAAAVGGAFSFLALARLDHGAFAVFPLLVWFFEIVAGGERRRAALTASLAFAIPMAVYAGVNLAYAGSAFPVSGAYKSTFPIPNAGTVSEAIELLKHSLSRHPIWRIFRHAPKLTPPVPVTVLDGDVKGDAKAVKRMVPLSAVP